MYIDGTGSASTYLVLPKYGGNGPPAPLVPPALNSKVQQELLLTYENP